MGQELRGRNFAVCVGRAPIFCVSDGGLFYRHNGERRLAKDAIQAVSLAFLPWFLSFFPSYSASSLPPCDVEMPSKVQAIFPSSTLPPLNHKTPLITSFRELETDFLSFIPPFFLPSLPPLHLVPLPPRCHLDLLTDHGLLSSASLPSVIPFPLPCLSNWSNFPPWLWWMCPALAPCPSTLAGLIKENIPWLPIFPRAWQPIILLSTWLESYYA